MTVNRLYMNGPMTPRVRRAYQIIVFRIRTTLEYRACMRGERHDNWPNMATPPTMWLRTYCEQPKGRDKLTNKLLISYRGNNPDMGTSKLAVWRGMHIVLAEKSLLQKQPFVPVPYGHLSRFWNRDSTAGTKALEAFVPGGRTGTKCPSR